MTAPYTHLLVGAVVFLCLLAGAWIGSLLRDRMPNHMLDGDTKEVVRLGMALLASIAALVLSLLISSSYGVYEAQRNDVRTLAADAINLDSTLRLYGEAARPARLLLRPSMNEMVDHLWSRPTENFLFMPNSVAEKAYLEILGLTPANGMQAALKAQALQVVGQMAQSRLRLYERSQPDMPVSLIFVLTAWMVCLFISFCLFSPLNHTSTVALVLVGFSIAAALFLLLELSEPFSGLVRLSDQPLTRALPAL
jgi:predicted membrane chloride channel (bestrophin family)